MTISKTLLGLSTAAQSAALLGENISTAKKKKKKNLLGQGVRNIMGAGLIGAQEKMISEM